MAEISFVNMAKPNWGCVSELFIELKSFHAVNNQAFAAIELVYAMVFSVSGSVVILSRLYPLPFVNAWHSYWFWVMDCCAHTGLVLITPF